MVAVLGLQAVPERVDPGGDSLAAHFLERTGHAQGADHGALLNGFPAVHGESRPPEFQRRVAGGHLRGTFSEQGLDGRGQLVGRGRRQRLGGRRLCRNLRRSAGAKRKKGDEDERASVDESIDHRQYVNRPKTADRLPGALHFVPRPWPENWCASATPNSAEASVVNGVNHCIAPQLGSWVISLSTVSCRSEALTSMYLGVV